MKYIDITEKLLNKKSKKFRLIRELYYIDNIGNKYTVDGKYILLKPTKREIEVANMLGKIYGGKIKIQPVVLYPPRDKNS